MTVPGVRPEHRYVVVYTWRPVGTPRAVIVLAHGVGEHARRYDELAETLVAAGYAVVADDHPSHGQTGERAGTFGTLGPGGMAAALRAAEEILTYASRHFPAIPVVLLGHSWGSLMAQKVFAKASEKLDALVLTGTSLAVPGILRPRAFNARWAGPDALGTEWLTRDSERVAGLADDPFFIDVDKNPVWTLAQAATLVSIPPRKVAHPVPVLILAGSNDPISTTGVGAAQLARAYRRRTHLPVTLRIYEGARHELFNELNRDRITADLIAWLDERFSTK